jgi:hypothetical protein
MQHFAAALHCVEVAIVRQPATSKSDRTGRWRDRMSGDVSMRRSQAIQRLPTNSVLGTLILHDGERSEALLFLPLGDDITRLVSPGDPFVPTIRDARFCLVARDAIAAIRVTAGGTDDRSDPDGLPIRRQRARVRLRSGTTLDGELQWTPLRDHERTSDHANEATSFLVIHDAEARSTYYIVKSQIATIEEL